ncbi:MAG TPA: type II secretion system protein [Solirubrobacterales bacterium]|jgi:type IV pilus assembly protein PilA|nr:type II secretion system protein [Solirubrobacterales bacterium]
MLQKLRERMGREEGFTLVELLVVMLILGLLAAIAIPSFFNQRDKARDADAKSLARTAQTAIETYATDHGGSYVGATPAALIAIENTLNGADGGDGSANGDALTVGNLAAQTYTVTVASANTPNTFSITRAANGTVTYPCANADNDGCPAGGWGG